MSVNDLANYLAKLQSNEEGHRTELITGEVTSLSPLTIRFGELNVTSPFLLLSKIARVEYVGQRVLAIKSNAGQQYYVLHEHDIAEDVDYEALIDELRSELYSQLDIVNQELATRAPLVHSHTWAQITDAPSTFPPSAHTHAWADITSPPTTATRWPAWSEVTEKPTTFTPSAHNQAWSTITETPADYPPSAHTHSWAQITDAPEQATRWPAWDEVGGKPLLFDPTEHLHDWADLYSIPATASRWPAWSEVTSKPTDFPPTAHNQGWSTITDKPTTATRWPAWSEVTDKPIVFQPDQHTHNYLSNSYLSGASLSDANSADGVGVTAYYLPSGATNRPTGGDHSLLTLSYSDSWSTQLASDWRTNEWYVRNQNNGTWGSWCTLYHTGNIPTQATRWPTWSEVTSKPSTFAPSTHTHTGTETTSAFTTHKTAYGEIRMGPTSSSWNHMNSTLDKPWYFYQDMRVASGQQVWHAGNSYGSLSYNGYERLQNGWIIQWGVITLPNGTRTSTITYPLAFPTTCRSIVGNWETNTAWTEAFVVSFGAPARTTCTVTCTRSDGAIGLDRVIRWMAIGY